MTIVLSIDEVSRLMKPVRGKGGWQALLRRLQAQLNGKTLLLNSRDIATIRRYRSRYGSGGWQCRLAFVNRLQIDSAA